MSEHLKYSIYIHLELCLTGIIVFYVEAVLRYKLCSLHVFADYIIFPVLWCHIGIVNVTMNV